MVILKTYLPYSPVLEFMLLERNTSDLLHSAQPHPSLQVSTESLTCLKKERREK